MRSCATESRLKRLLHILSLWPQVWRPAGCQGGLDPLQMRLYADPELFLLGDTNFATFRLSRYVLAPYGIGHAVISCGCVQATTANMVAWRQYSCQQHNWLCGLSMLWRQMLDAVLVSSGNQVRLAEHTIYTLPGTLQRLQVQSLLAPFVGVCSCKTTQFGHQGMPGRVLKSGCVQVVQNLRIIPDVLHPRSRLSEPVADHVGEIVYIPVFDTLHPHIGPVAVLEALLSARATDSMLVANFISLAGTVLSSLQVRTTTTTTILYCWQRPTCLQHSVTATVEWICRAGLAQCSIAFLSN
eukprot:GHRR01011650.1.p1 GENE.GHRR01011650.1~~GHRR01011650.1.p1  ORF type:complete len:298 (+),score=33.43 GHRR01011650.1:550-1443(+)